ncbi:MAG TPA: IclR family transcriptional regulator [Chloroflexota bacterium]
MGRRGPVDPFRREGGRTLSTAARVLQVLDLIAQEPGKVTAKRIALRLGVSQSTAYYLIHTLKDHGFIQRGGWAKGLELGPKIAHMYESYVSRSPQVEQLGPVLDELGKRTEARAYLAVWTEKDLQIVRIRGRHGLRELPNVNAGFRGAAHALALGKVFLARLPSGVWPQYLQAPEFPVFTEHTVRYPDQLVQQLHKVAEQGIAFDLEEYTPGSCCIAAPVYDQVGRLAASLAISVPVRRFQTELGDLVDCVRTASEQASAELRH